MSIVTGNGNWQPFYVIKSGRKFTVQLKQAAGNSSCYRCCCCSFNCCRFYCANYYCKWIELILRRVRFVDDLLNSITLIVILFFHKLFCACVFVCVKSVKMH